MRSIALILGIPLIAGCVHVNAEQVAPANKYPPVAAEGVEVFTSAQELKDRGYRWETVAILFAHGSAMYTSNQGMLHKVREEAGKRGANGIILAAQKDPNFGEQLLLGAGAERKSEVVAVHWWLPELTVASGESESAVDLATSQAIPVDTAAVSGAGELASFAVLLLEREEAFYRDHQRYAAGLDSLGMRDPKDREVYVTANGADGVVVSVGTLGSDHQILCVGYLGFVDVSTYPANEPRHVRCAQRD